MQKLNTSEDMIDIRDHAAMWERKSQERQAAIAAAPLEYLTIATPEECKDAGIIRDLGFEDMPYDRCDYCRQHNGNIHANGINPAPHRRQCDTAACIAEVDHRKYVERTTWRLDASGLIGREYNHTFAAWVKRPQNQRVYDALIAWEPGEDNGVYLLGETSPANPTGNGTGKSYALHALCVQLCERDTHVKFCRTVDFLKELRGSYDEERGLDEYQIIEDYSTVPVLLWDDLGKEALKGDWAAEKFYLVIDERSRRGLPVVISSNYALDQIEQRFGDNFGPAIASRLIGMCPVRLKLGGTDWRMK